MLFKCKMCGGNLEFVSGATVVQCQCCGTKQTLPRLSDERISNLYDRANHFRRNNDYDKALDIYEQILSEDRSDSESYWSIVLCRYGIEYVEDPDSHEIMPTVNRAQFTSIFDDEDYKSALLYADKEQKEVYEQEANLINEIQKNILAISQNEEPFDVFICYKETDANGRRTPDSVLATELYHELVKEGFKVFFSRITLEDKLGQEYEPYIFAALNSAKVMVALGTKPEYFNAVWVKNEWSRYLALIKNGAKKMFIPAYKGMDPYDLPEEFSHLQAQDMSKLGFMQDLIRGIKKIIDSNNPKITVNNVSVETNVNAVALLKRAFIFLEDANWESADEYCEKALDIDPENAKAYLVKLMIDLQVKNEIELGELAIPFENNGFYQKAFRYADAKLKNTLQGYIDSINERNEKQRLSSVYQEAKTIMENAESQAEYLLAAEKFGEILEFENAQELADECCDLAEKVHNEGIYASGCRKLEKKSRSLKALLSSYKKALSEFEQIPEYKDSGDKISKLKSDIDELNMKIETRRKRNKRIVIIISSTIVFFVAFFWALFNFIIPQWKYNSADKLVKNKDYLAAISIYEELADYRDSTDKMISTRYLLASSQLDNKEYQNAYDNFSLIREYKDSEEKRQESGYAYAQMLMADEKYLEAINIITTIKNYEGTTKLENQCYLEYAKQLYSKKSYYYAITWYEKIGGYDKNAEFYLDSCYYYALQQIRTGKYDEGITYLEKAGDYNDADEQIKIAKYGYINRHKSNKDSTTYKYLKELKSIGYKDSAAIYKELYTVNIELKCLNTNSDDYNTKLSYIPRKTNYLHMEFVINGLKPDEKITISHATTWPSTRRIFSDWYWENISIYDSKLGVEWSDGATSSNGMFTIEFYNAETGAFLDQISIPVK